MKKKNNSKPGLRVFLSYDKADRSNAQKLMNILNSSHPEVSIFTLQMLSAGEDWETRLRDEIQKCSMLIAILSPASMKSKWVLQEIGAAWVIEKPIVLLATHPAIALDLPLNLSQLQVYPLDEIEEPEMLDKILKSAANQPAPTDQ